MHDFNYSMHVRMCLFASLASKQDYPRRPVTGAASLTRDRPAMMGVVLLMPFTRVPRAVARLETYFKGARDVMFSIKYQCVGLQCFAGSHNRTHVIRQCST